MNQEVARIALQFLARVDLKGAEAPALMQVLAALEQIANSPRMGQNVSAQDFSASQSERRAAAE